MISDFYEKLVNGKKPIAVELDPPNNVNNYEKFLAGIAVLKDAGVDIITMADCPSGNPRIDSSIAASHVFTSNEIDVIPHLTCRDKNIVALKSQLMGLYAMGIRNTIIVTGDGIPKERRNEVKSVFQFSSRGFATFARKLSDEAFTEPMHFFGALNVNAKNFKDQIKLAKEKVANGMNGLFTQPILTEAAFENLKRAKEELDCFILGGIIPVTSENNARFMNENINGIQVDEKVISMYAGLDKQACEELAVQISTEIAERIKNYIDGYYFITPFLRADLMTKILKNIY